MKVEVCVLCDAATIHAGKMNILGIFDAIQVGEFPSPKLGMAVAVRIRFEPIEAGEHNVRLAMFDDDGSPVFPALNGKITVRGIAGMHSVALDHVLNLQGVCFPKPGNYAIDFAVDGRQEGTIPIIVMQAKARGAAPLSAPPAE